MLTDGLLDAAAVLDNQAAGRLPDRGRVLTGAEALDTLCRDEVVDHDILEAAAELQMVAEGRALVLDGAGRARAARLAAAVRKVATGA